MRKLLKWVAITVVGIVGVVLVITAVLVLIGRSRLNARHELAATLPPEVVASASAEKGEVIAVTRGCTDCHDDGMKGKVFLDIPPGLIVAPNLTKGRGGIGGRYASLQDWEHAIRHGVRPDGTVLLPFMPYDFFNRLSDADVASVSAYLASLPDVDNVLPATRLRVPGYTMMGMPGSRRESLIAKLCVVLLTTFIGVHSGSASAQHRRASFDVSQRNGPLMFGGTARSAHTRRRVRAAVFGTPSLARPTRGELPDADCRHLTLGIVCAALAFRCAEPVARSCCSCRPVSRR